MWLSLLCSDDTARLGAGPAWTVTVELRLRSVMTEAVDFCVTTSGVSAPSTVLLSLSESASGSPELEVALSGRCTYSNGVTVPWRSTEVHYAHSVDKEVELQN